MSDESDPYLKSSQSSKSKQDISEGSSSTPSLYSVTQEVKKRALSAYRKKLPPLSPGIDQPNKAKTEVLWGRKPSRKHVQNLAQDDVPSTVIDFLADEGGLGGSVPGTGVSDINIGRRESGSKSADQAGEVEEFSGSTVASSQGERHDDEDQLHKDQGEGDPKQSAGEHTISRLSRESGTEKETESFNEGNLNAMRYQEVGGRR